VAVGIADDIGVAEAVGVGTADADRSAVGEVKGKLESAGAAQPASRLNSSVPIANLNVMAGSYRRRTAATLRLSLMTEKVCKVADCTNYGRRL
jgi:hypothetical protein